jgi:hypothetical protein
MLNIHLKKEFSLQPSKEPTPWGGSVTRIALSTGHSSKFSGSYKPRVLHCRHGGIVNPEFDQEMKNAMKRYIAELSESNPELVRFSGKITSYFMEGGLPLKVVFTLD